MNIDYMNIDYKTLDHKSIAYKLDTITNSNSSINSINNVNDDHFNVLFKLFCYIILRYFI